MKRPDFLERVAQARRTAQRKYLYAIAKTDKGFALERARMILN